jgi:hypothetical protein
MEKKNSKEVIRGKRNCNLIFVMAMLFIILEGSR